MAVSGDNHCVIEKLPQTPFSLLSYNEKLKIIESVDIYVFIHVYKVASLLLVVMLCHWKIV
jgi:hypothetical protein